MVRTATILGAVLAALAGEALAAEPTPGPAAAEAAPNNPAPAAAAARPAPDVQPATDAAWTVSVGTGAGGFWEFVDSAIGVEGSYDASRAVDRLQVDLRVDRELGRMARAGLAYVHNRWTDALYSAATRVGSVRNRAHVLMADATLRWIRTARFELYSALAVGAGRWEQEGEGIAADHHRVACGLAFQVRYAGIALGGERFRAFVDLGIGFEGLVVGGLQGRF